MDVDDLELWLSSTQMDAHADCSENQAVEICYLSSAFVDLNVLFVLS